VIYLILIAAFLLRLLTINQSLWLDEAINVNVATSLNPVDLVTKYSLGDFHPPLYHVILKLWILVFGNSEFSVRMPSVIFGTVTCLAVYALGKKLFDEKTALVAATLMATAPLAIYYSHEARMYMLAAMLVSISLYFFVSVLKRESILNWVGFIVSTALLLYSDYLPYLIIPIYVAYLFSA
jgi:uncharacterized membrane protein